MLDALPCSGWLRCSRIEGHYLVPIDRPVFGAKVANELLGKTIHDFRILLSELLISLLGFMAQGLNDFLVHRLASGDQFPEWLPTKFLVVTLFRSCVAPVATTVDSDQVMLVADDLSRLTKVVAHLLYLTGVPPVRPRLDGYEIAGTVAVKFEIDTFSCRFTPIESLLTNKDGQAFEKIAKNSFFLR